MLSNRSLRCLLTPQMILCIFMALKILWITVSKSMKLKEALLQWTLTSCLCLCFSSVHGVVNAAHKDHFPGERGETHILSCLLLPAPCCPAVSQWAHGRCVWRALCTWNSKLHLVSYWVSQCNRKGPLLWCSYYPIMPFSTTVAVSHSSYCMHQFFGFSPFPKIYISPRHGFTNLSPSAFDERLFAGFFSSHWWLTFFLV